jgi:hypothetical protein
MTLQRLRITGPGRCFWDATTTFAPMNSVPARWCGVFGLALALTTSVASPANADPEGPERIAEVVDRVTVSAARGMDRELVVAVERAAMSVGAQTTIVHQGSVDLLGVSRGVTQLQLAPPGAVFPLSTLGVDASVIGATMSETVASALAAGEMVLGRSSAELRGAVPGDQIVISGWDGVAHAYRVGAIAEDELVGGTEALLDTKVAAAMGLVRPSSMRIWDFTDRDALDQALAAQLGAAPVRIRHSWDRPRIDDTIGQGRLKQLLGEFSFGRGRRGAITPETAWQRANLVVKALPILGRMRCHKVVAEAAANALGEVLAQGLAGSINVRDTRRYGGCYGPREVRTDRGTSGHNLSRHSWGAALDINPSSNRFGRAPTMDPRVVDIFRKHGFAWGGSFLIPDGMHFEYIGEPRI